MDVPGGSAGALPSPSAVDSKLEIDPSPVVKAVLERRAAYRAVNSSSADLLDGTDHPARRVDLRRAGELAKEFPAVARWVDVYEAAARADVTEVVRLIEGA